MKLNRSEVWDQTYRAFHVHVGKGAFSAYTAVSLGEGVEEDPHLSSAIALEVYGAGHNSTLQFRDVTPTELRRIADTCLNMADHLEVEAKRQVDEVMGLLDRIKEGTR